jgi:hypothetical protein
MNQRAPVLPSYETSVLEPLFDLDPKLDPAILAVIQSILHARLNTVYYQFLNLQLKAVQPLSELPVIGTVKPGAVPNQGSIALTGPKGIITTEALTTPAGVTYTLTLTNPQIEAASLLMLTVSNGTNTAGLAVVESFVVGNGLATIQVKNAGAAAFNGTLVIQFLVQ